MLLPRASSHSQNRSLTWLTSGSSKTCLMTTKPLISRYFSHSSLLSMSNLQFWSYISIKELVQIFIQVNPFVIDSVVYFFIYNSMQLKTWLLWVRVINVFAALLMVVFETWFIIDLLRSHVEILVLIIRMFTPAFVILLAVIIVTAEFKFTKVVEHFKFLQFMPGLALFYLLYIVMGCSIASILAFQFTTVSLSWAAGLSACVFLLLAVVTAIVGCIRPAGVQSLIAAQD